MYSKLTDPKQSINQRLRDRTHLLLSRMKSGERCRIGGGPRWLYWLDRCLSSFLSCAARCCGNTSNPVIEMQLARAVISLSDNNAFKRHSGRDLQELLLVSCRFQISMSSTPDSLHSVKFCFFFFKARPDCAAHERLIQCACADMWSCAPFTQQRVILKEQGWFCGTKESTIKREMKGLRQQQQKGAGHNFRALKTFETFSKK